MTFNGRAIVAAFVAYVTASGSAVAYLATNEWFGAGDLAAMAVYTAPLAALIFLFVRASWFQDRLTTVARYVVAVAAGLLLGMAWTVIVAILLGGWILAFSFPVAVCWLFGGVCGAVAGAGLANPRTWSAAASLLVLASLGVTYQFHYAQSPPPGIVVYLQSSATHEDVQRVWTEVLGFPTGLGHQLKDGISGVAAAGYSGDQRMLSVTFWKSTRRIRRDQLISEIRQSPLVERVEAWNGSEPPDVRSSVEY